MKEKQEEIKEEVKVEQTNQEEELIEEQIEQIPEPEEAPLAKSAHEDWAPKTDVGIKVKKGEISDIDEVLNTGKSILESEIVDILVPNLETDLLLIGQSKGKFGGGQRRVFRQTQKKTREGNKPSFATYAVVGNRNGYVGVGYGKSKETVPAREKAFRRAKLNIFRIRRGCGSWECNCKEPHSIPFTMHAKVGSVQLTLMPAPKGKGLVCEPEIAKILRLAGINDVWSKMLGQTKVRINTIGACVKALQNGIKTKVLPKSIEETGMIEGSLKSEEVVENE